jgi:hypothetical protein
MRLIALGGIVACVTLGAAGSAGAAVLYSQLPAGEFSSPVVPSHDFSDDSSDSSAVDDFIVGDGQVWTVQRIEALGAALSDGSHTASVSLFADADAAPGSPLFSQSGLPAPGCGGSQAAPGRCNLSLPLAGPTLTPGSYWLSVQTAGESAWAWHLHTPEQAFGNPALWRNPGSACSTYTQISDCGWSTAADGKDLAFALTGTMIDSRFSVVAVTARGIRLFARVDVPADGTMTIGGKGVKRATKQLPAGEQRLRVRLRRGIIDRLRTGRKAKVRVKLTFTATGGDAYTQRTRATLVPVRRAGALRVAR